jgi:peroxiredoxin
MLTIRFDEEDHHHPAPDFNLSARDGRQVSLRDFHERSNLVLVFLPGECPDCDSFLHELASRSQEFRLADARLVAVLPKLAKELPAFAPTEIELLSDPEQAVRRLYAGLMAPGLVGERDLLCFVLDNYGAPYACLAGPRLEDTDLAEVLSWLNYIGIQCPE